MLMWAIICAQQRHGFFPYSSITMKIAVEGCCHGELDKIYETITHLEKEQNIKVSQTCFLKE